MITLLCGADPRTCKRGPSVRLQAGHWKLYHDGFKDTLLTLVIESTSERIVSRHDVVIELKRPEIVHLEFDHRGSEPFIIVNTRKMI